MRQNNLQGSARSGDYVRFSLYGVSYLAINVIRTDSTSTDGEIYLVNEILKQYDYEESLYKSGPPALLYGFTAAGANDLINAPALFRSTAAAPVESISNRGLILSGGNLAASTYMVPRLAGKSFQVPLAVQVRDVIGGPVIAANENAGTPYSIGGWVYRQNAASQVGMYVETNAAVTSFIGVFINTTGTISLLGSTGPTTTSVAALSIQAWHYVEVTYDGTNVRFYIDGALANTVARAHTTGLVTTEVRLNNNAPGQILVQSVAVQPGVAVPAGEVSRRWFNITSDPQDGAAVNQGGTMGQGAGFLGIFSDSLNPQSATITVGGFVAVLPIVGVALISFHGAATAMYAFDVTIIQSEEIQ